MKNFMGYTTGKRRSLDEHYMKLALEAAEVSKSRGDAARGAVLAFPDGCFVAGDSVFSEHHPLAYAELNALNKASQTKNKSFKDAILYSTIEPNSFCATAAYEHGIREFVFGTNDNTNGFISSPKSIIAENFGLSFMSGILSEDCYNIASPTLRESLKKQNEITTRNSEANG